MELFEEITQAIQNLGGPSKIELIHADEAKSVVATLKHVFIEGNPSKLWHGFKSQPLQLDCDDLEEIKGVINNNFKDDIVYLILEDDNYYVIKTIPNLVTDILKEIRFIEYYVVNISFNKLIAENDHSNVMLITPQT